MPRTVRRPLASNLPIQELQLATLIDEPPDGSEWLHEQKFDGYRILAVCDAGQITLLSRRFLDWTAKFPGVARALAEHVPRHRAIFDGEVAALLPDGRTSFQLLQRSFRAGAPELAYFAFDLLELGGERLLARPLEERKAKLAELVPPGPSAIRYSDHLAGNGAAFFQAACRRGLEGIVSKRRDKPYLPGRGLAWVKTKCLQRQELVVGGYTEPERSRTGFGALLVGYYEGDRLVYAGKVGTGYTNAMLAELRRELEPLEREACPFEPEPPRAWTGKARHWVKPALVAEVAFGEWTDDGKLRHPAFQGLRRDKRPRDVVRERPAHEPRAATAPRAGSASG
jgi:bifunctional non-homologous end joining protein LigD